MKSTNPLIAMFASEPALVAPEMRDRFEACLNALAASEDGQKLLAEQAGCNDDGFWLAPDDWRARYRPYVVRDGILHIPVKGVLLHDFPWAIGPWATGYEYIWRAFERGCEDFKAGNIKGIALLQDSPGGMVAGCFDAIDRAAQAKAESGVPVRSFAHEMAYSAAYAWFCLGDVGVMSRTGGVGSVGVVTGHLDVSKAMKASGYKFTFIFAGRHKVDGNPFEVLPEAVRARIQSRIDELHDVFVASVAANRPKLSEQAVRASEALTFTASQALSNGFADQVGSLDDALAAFAADLSSTTGDEEMSTSKDQSAATVSAADHETAVVAARAEGHAAGVTEGAAAGAAAERELIFAILDSDEAKTRPAAARALAAEGGRTLAQATAFLARLPEEGKQSADGTGVDFTAAMNGTDHPEVGVGRSKGDHGEAQDDGSDVVALAVSAGLAGFKAPATK